MEFLSPKLHLSIYLTLDISDFVQPQDSLVNSTKTNLDLLKCRKSSGNTIRPSLVPAIVWNDILQCNIAQWQIMNMIMYIS